MASNKSNGFWELVKTVVYAVVIAVVVRTFLFEPFSIPSGSMIPTLLVGDYLFVSKYSYGYSRYSLPFGMPLFSGRLLADQPERGDVVVFKLPTDNTTDYIKRVIGLPGDRIQLKNGLLYINDEPVKREPAGQFIAHSGLALAQTYHRYIETLPNGRQHPIIEISDSGPFDNTGVYTVPEGSYFMMGDNRDSSRDSRFLSEVGYVPFENLIGRARVIFFSVDGEALAFWDWYKTVRFDRLFQIIE
ncbi:MAG: signal peptidase I [Rhodospirillales bacterium]|nr:signal peptidase I [Rhodospirillales bacterium]